MAIILLNSIPERIRGRLAVYSSQEVARLLRDLLLLESAGLCDLDDDLRGDLAEMTSSGIATLGPKGLVELLGALTPTLIGLSGKAADSKEDAKDLKIKKLHSQLLVSFLLFNFLDIICIIHTPFMSCCVSTHSLCL